MKLILNITWLDVVTAFKKKNGKNKKMSLQQMALKSKGGKRQFLKKQVLSVYDLMKDTNQEKQAKNLIIKCVVCAIIGIAFSIAIHNYIALPFITFGFMIIPIWQLKLYKIRYTKYLASQLESTISLITTAYIRCDNIIKSVEDNIEYIDPIIKPVFEEFLTEHKINSNMESCIRSMQYKINNSIFNEWCLSLIRAYHNSSLKNDLVLIASKLSVIREVQDDIDTETSNIIHNYIIIMIMLVCTIPMIYLINYEWFTWLFTTTLGKCAITFGVFSLIVGISRLITLSMPVQFKK